MLMMIVSLIKVSLSNPGLTSEEYRKVFSLIPRQLIKDQNSNNMFLNSDKELDKRIFRDNTIAYLLNTKNYEKNETNRMSKKRKKFGMLSKKNLILKSKKFSLPIILEESSSLESEKKENTVELIENNEKDFYETIDIKKNKKNGKHYRTCRFCLILKVNFVKVA